MKRFEFFLAFVLAVSMGSTIALAASLGDCLGLDTPSGQYCANERSCTQFNTCMAGSWTCSDGSCGANPCQVRKWTHVRLVGDCTSTYWPGYTCTSCTTYYCASGSAYVTSDVNGNCIGERCALVFGWSPACQPPGA